MIIIGKTFNLIILNLYLILSLIQNVEGQVEYFHGTIMSDTTLSADTIKVIGDINVLNGITLIINKGVYIEFQDYYRINIKGSLIAVGEVNDTIVFTTKDTIGFADTSTVSGSWAGIQFDNTSTFNDSSIIKYCKFMYGKKQGDILPEYSGGAIYIDNFSKILISNSSFSYNIATKHGGGIYCGNNSSPHIEQCYFFNNRSYYQGGGIYIGANSNAKIINNLFFHNIALGIIYAYPYSAIIGSGGGIHSTSSYLNSNGPIIEGNKFFNNKSINGGGVYESNHNILIVNNLICNNKGGGIFNGHQLGKGKYVNNTICNNSWAGGIYSYSSKVQIVNNIIWGNTNWFPDYGTNQIINKLGSLNVTYSNVQYGYNGIGNIDSLPLFVLPTNGAGVSFNGLEADWSLQINSPCVDAGISDTIGLNIPIKDIMGNPRIFNNIIDMGAIENQSINEIFNLLPKKAIIFYPNPTDNYLFFKTNLNQSLDLEIYNINGKSVLKEKNINSKRFIDVKHLKTGTYLYRVFNENKLIDNGKIFIE